MVDSQVVVTWGIYILQATLISYAGMLEATLISHAGSAESDRSHLSIQDS